MGENLPANVAEALVQTVREVRDAGFEVNSAGVEGGGFTEILRYTTGMANPLARVGKGALTLNTVGAVARFTWLVSGSDRLEDIAYYEPRVRSYTDDGLSVPGSSYGKRIFNASPGTNQMHGIVSELKNQPDSRRAAAVVWLPEDAIRPSADIPCTFGLFFHLRDGGVTMTTVMRSNNAVTLVPYNFFEFSMIGELVAAELGVPFDTYVHWAASMHTFPAHDVQRDKILSVESPEAHTMPGMPRGAALEKAYSLAKFETRLRHAGTAEELRHVAKEAREELGEYWAGFFDVLYTYGLAKRAMRDEALAEFERLPAHFKPGAKRSIDTVLGPVVKDETAQTSVEDSDALFELNVIEQLAPTTAERVVLAASRAGDADWLLAALRELSTSEEPVTVEEMSQIQAVLRRRDVELASRDADAPAELTPQDVAAALDEVRKNSRS